MDHGSWAMDPGPLMALSAFGDPVAVDVAVDVVVDVAVDADGEGVHLLDMPAFVGLGDAVAGPEDAHALRDPCATEPRGAEQGMWAAEVQLEPGSSPAAPDPPPHARGAAALVPPHRDRPDSDGRGGVVAFVDTGADPGAEGLQVCHDRRPNSPPLRDAQDPRSRKRQRAASAHPARPPSRRIAERREPSIEGILPAHVVQLFWGPPPPCVTRSHGRSLKCVHVQPNIFEVEDFLTTAEVDELVAVAGERRQQFKRSYTDDPQGVRIYSEERTSTFTWLKKFHSAATSKIEHRAADIVGVPAANVEPLQIVRYTKGQEFKSHHDAGELLPDGTVELAYPRRLFTFFVYLTDTPEGVGHTEFVFLRSGAGAEPGAAGPGSGGRTPRGRGEQGAGPRPRGDAEGARATRMSVQPRRAKAVLFPNVRRDGTPDPLTSHCARPVPGDSLKLGLNVWVTDVSQLQHAL